MSLLIISRITCCLTHSWVLEHHKVKSKFKINHKLRIKSNRKLKRLLLKRGNQRQFL